MRLNKNFLPKLAVCTLFWSPSLASANDFGKERLPVSIPKSKGLVDGTGTVPLSSPANFPGATLSYDTGPAFFFPQQALAGSFWSVRFSPLQTCSLVSFSVVSAGGPGNVRFHLFSDSAGFPHREMMEPFPFQLSGDLLLQTFEFPAPLDVGAADFHVAVELLTGGAPYVTGDDDGGTGRSSYRAPGGNWRVVDIADFVLRAAVRYYGPDAIGPEIAHQPVEAAFSGDGEMAISAKIWDEAGISGAQVFYSVDGGAYRTAAMQPVGELFEARIPLPPSGSEISYFIEGRDASARRNATRLPASGSANPFGMPVYPGREIKYDDGTAEDFFIAAPTFDDNRFAVLLTPSAYPAEINALRVLVNDTAEILLSIYSDSAGLPGKLLAGPHRARSASPGEKWIHLALPEGARPVIEAGGFFAVLQWLPTLPQTPGVGADQSFVEGRSFFYTQSGGWKNWTFNDWILRAAFEPASKPNETLPNRFALGQNFPNPFNPATEIRFRLAEPGEAELVVYNIVGQKVKTLTRRFLAAGEHSVTWDGRDERGRMQPSGVYLYQLTSGRLAETRKMVLIK